MQLQYLDFDFSDEDSGRGSFDAMATVAPSRIPDVLAEIGVVLDWASRVFGPAAAQGSGGDGGDDGEDGEDGDWDFELQAIVDDATPIDIRWNPASGQVSLGSDATGSLITFTFTLSGSRALCEAFTDAFGQSD